ncbi:Complement C3 [Merluccius polli]|uniref:Complement C3 n=1 Tax=Merluccius polli TaxID=89951 RepID=A0AA47MBS5_MERPO|nr:Complement C3 [Merluccius polli]
MVLPEESVSLVLGVYSGIYQLPEIVSVGVWKVVATFDNNKKQNFSTEFEVQEYVLPSFEVKITTERNYFYVDDDELTIDIEATYLFGKEVRGTAYVVFGFIDKNKETNNKHSFQGSIQHVVVANGKAKATLKRDHILKTTLSGNVNHIDNIEQLVKNFIYVAVTVLTESGSEMVETEKQDIQIVKTPYTIHLKNTPKYFKPTMFFEVVIYVENPDGSPANDVPLLVDPGNIDGMIKNGFARVAVNPISNANNQHLVIKVKTNDPQVSVDRQASATMTALAYMSSIKSYLHIGVGSPDVMLGDPLKITFNLNAPVSTRDLTYLIQSRGQLVKYGHFKTALSTIAHTLHVTKEMMPSFRIIAYYRDRGEVISDSVWVDVTDTCMGSLKLEPAKNTHSGPRQTFRYKITGDPGATVGLVAVDKGVYTLNNKHRLTQSKAVWDIVEKADTGCTPGGGHNNMKVFYDAGLLFQSNIIATADRLVSEYKDPLQRQCCLDGMTGIPLSYGCARRSTYISDGKACFDAFLKCCEEIDKLQTESKSETLYLARSEERNLVFRDSGQITTRTEFPESWLWLKYKLPLCPDGTTNCKTTSLEKSTVLKDSITTWHLTGISLSPTHGICVNDKLEIIVQKDFFIDLRLPYSAVRGEQIEIKAILHNYLLDEIIVQVYLMEEPDVCSSASKRNEYTQTVRIAKESTHSVPFIIIPMKHGKYPIVVKASVANRQIDDGVSRELLVVVKGPVVQTFKNVIDVTYIQPNTPRRTQIYVTGGSAMNLLVEKVLSGSSMGSLIKQPSGCGEQNMIGMTLPVIAATYLDKTKQWDKVGFSKRDEALLHIKTGYRNELAFRKADGSFAVFNDRPGQTWLTGYVAKVFAMAKALTDIDSDSTVICGAIKWVIRNSQMTDGHFKEIGKAIHGEMMGDVHGLDTDASMTAFSLIAMQETRPVCADIVTLLPGSIRQAVDYLERQLPTLKNPYAVAMVSYALANENKLNKEILKRFASPDGTHWPVPRGYCFTLEATAYALLALVKAKEFEDAAPVVRWLNTQRTGGGFQSTQSTIMVYQAIAEYWVNAKEQQYEMDVAIHVKGRSPLDPTRVSNDNAFQTRSSKINDINQEVSVTATGSGEATVSVVSWYYALPRKSQTSACEKFELNVELIPEKDAGMTILDIGLLTGYTPDLEDLNILSKGRDKTISKYELGGVFTDRGSLIIYLPKVSHEQREEVAFRIRQNITVGVLQPAAVSVYEYYNHRNLQHALGRFAAECQAVGMRVSTSKSEAMVLCRKMVGSELLPQVKEFKYLGTLFPSEGKMEREMDRRIGAASAVMRALYQTVVVKRKLSRKAKLSIYQSIYVPTLTYGHQLWVVTESTRSRIQAAEMSFLRRVAGLSFRDRVFSKYQISLFVFLAEKPCVKFYHPVREHGQLIKLCDRESAVCKCAEEECSMQKKGEIKNNERNEKACDAEAKIDYVYKVKLESYDDEKITDYYMMRIQQVIKDGSSDINPEAKLRRFIGYSHCREALGLREKKDYLIMGTLEITQNTGVDDYQYILGEKTWIEYWPTDLECQTETEYGPTCEGMEALMFMFQNRGCRA